MREPGPSSAISDAPGPAMRALPALAVTISALLLAACSGDGSAPASATESTAAYGVFTGSIDLKGEISLKGSFTDTITSRQETCDQYVRGLAPATTLWVVPAPNTGVIVGSHIVSLSAGVPTDKPSTGYHGPGSYSEPSAIVADLIIDNTSFIAGDKATATITVAQDGSGSLSFTDMEDTSNFARESGSEQWKCRG